MQRDNNADTFFDRVLPKLCSLLTTQLRLDAQMQQSLITSAELQTRLSARHNKQRADAVEQTVFHLRGLSLDVVARLMAIATEMRHLDQIIESEANVNSDTLRAQSERIEQIEQTLAECSDEFGRLALFYQREIHGRTDDSKIVARDATANIKSNPQLKYSLKSQFDQYSAYR